MKFSGLSDAKLAHLSTLQPEWEVQQIEYGESQIPVIIIDNFSQLANDLIEDSQAQTFRTYGPYYPGVQAHAPIQYLTPNQQALNDLIVEAFDFSSSKITPDMCMYSYVTTPENELNATQRYPHFDGGNPRKVALLHYLCDEDHGGTQFYRHDRTGFETLFPERQIEYSKARQKDLTEYGLRESAYFEGTGDGFSRLKLISARFNRAILYPSSTLHSGYLGANPKYALSPSAGRLTVNTFFVPT